MTPQAHDMVAALFDTPREYIEVLAAAGLSPVQELVEALAEADGQ